MTIRQIADELISGASIEELTQSEGLDAVNEAIELLDSRI